MQIETNSEHSLPRTANPAPVHPAGPRPEKRRGTLEEALCFAWIDGRMQSIDGKTYRQYFSMRRQQSKWPKKTKFWQKAWSSRELITDFAERKSRQPRKTASWMRQSSRLLPKSSLPAFRAFGRAWACPREFCRPPLPLSAQKTCARAYLGAKTPGERRMAWMAE